MDKIRVMHVISSGRIGGGEETVRLLAKYLDKARFEVTVVCPESPLLEKLWRLDGIRTHALRFPTIPSLGSVLRLAGWIRQEKPQIVHTHLYHGDLYGWLATRIAPVPRLISTIQGVNFFWEMESGFRRWRWRLLSRFSRSIYRSYDGMAACSQALVEAVCARPGVSILRSKMRAIHNSFDSAELAVPARQAGGNGAGKILTVANFAPFKGHAVLLEAVAQVKAKRPVECLLVGDGPERPAMESRAQSLGLNGSVRFLGVREDVPALLAQTDLFVFPSRWEPFGIALVEAMAAGLPVVACAAGGVPEIVRDGENGLLVQPDDPASLARAIERLLDDPALREKIARAGKASAARFDAPEMARAYARWYEELAA